MAPSALLEHANGASRPQAILEWLRQPGALADQTARVDPAQWAQAKAEQTVAAQADGPHAAKAQPVPLVTDAEIAPYGAGTKTPRSPTPARPRTTAQVSPVREAAPGGIGAMSS
jgi:hypothetical protein